ncbi:P2X purinoceptor 7 [Dissostichus eleginoides]|uniref:P2X purinoceptor 7 n=1 Tax=Dissostichus eleginoides TaxID=100907 RepID=A0AAD9C3N3_DISEL|nr:P2X purinoceptor 7 [Dissostichus eleginoides]
MRAWLPLTLSTLQNPAHLVKEEGPGVESEEDVIERRGGEEEEEAEDGEARIQGLSLQQSHQLLELCLTRDPSLMFDLLRFTSDAPPPGPPVEGQPTWCVCHNCREMSTDVERKCCGQPHDSCVSSLPHMEVYILQEGVLRLARRIWNDIRAVADLQDTVESNKQFRYAAYRQFVVWQYGALGQGHRVVIPSCFVWKIRDRYPDPHGQYKGFIPSRV